MPWPTYSRTTEKPFDFTCCSTVPQISNSRLPARTRSMAISSDSWVTRSSFLRLLAHFPDRHGDGRIAIIPVQLHPGVDGNDVALLQNPLGIRHPMDDLLVHRSAQHKSKRFAGGRHVIALESGLGSGIADHLVRGHFEVHGAGPFHRDLFQLLQDLPNQQAAAPHLFQFRGGFSNDHQFSNRLAESFRNTASGGSLLASTSITRAPARPQILQNRPGLPLIRIQPLADHLFAIIFPPHQLLAVQIAQLIHFRRAKQRRCTEFRSEDTPGVRSNGQ